MATAASSIPPSPPSSTSPASEPERGRTRKRKWDIIDPAGQSSKHPRMNNVHHRTPAASPARVPHVLDNVPDLRSAPNRSSSASPIRASRSVSPKRAITALKDRGCIYLLHPGPGVSEDARVRELRVRLAKLKEFIPTEWQERLEAGDPSGIDDIDDTAAFGQQGVYTEDDWESIRRICSDAALCADLHKDENAWTLVVQEVFRLALRTAPLGDRCFELNN
ncbi:hypothetical protein H2203_009275, partial [Taxawa tesnikishii (nom. ined.)]